MQCRCVSVSNGVLGRTARMRHLHRRDNWPSEVKVASLTRIVCADSDKDWIVCFIGPLDLPSNNLAAIGRIRSDYV